MSEKIKFVQVDKKNRIVGPLSEAGCLSGVLHKSVSVLVFNDSGDIAIQKRSMNRSLFPGMYTLSATGHVDWKEDGPEDDETAARREFQEELGKPAPEVLEYKFTAELDAPGHHIMSSVYFAHDNGPFSPDPEEVESVEFYKVGEISRIAGRLTPTAKMNLEKLGILK